MNVMLNQFIEARDYTGLAKLLSENPLLANEGISFDSKNSSKAHPLHRVCDAVFNGICSDEEAVNIARIFIDHKADINGGHLIQCRDTPLIAACSLHADKVAILYIENGANIQHQGTHGGTALHWAAWCGRPEVVEKLINAGANINQRCIDFNSTPLFWTIHGYSKNQPSDSNNYQQCVSLLLNAGANKQSSNKDGKTILELLREDDIKFRTLLS